MVASENERKAIYMAESVKLAYSQKKHAYSELHEICSAPMDELHVSLILLNF